MKNIINNLTFSYFFIKKNSTNLLVLTLLSIFLGGTKFAHADEIADVSKLLRSGQFSDALSKADAYLSKRPKDAQMRFLKGVILTEENRSGEAISTFTKLTEDFPELPEPYNNLAVLYAAAGQFEKARGSLDMAIRTNPTYATAYENLGDIHAKLASQAYDKAFQLDSSNAGAKSKLTLVKTLSGSLGGVAISKQSAAINSVNSKNSTAAANSESFTSIQSKQSRETISIDSATKSTANVAQTNENSINQNSKKLEMANAESKIALKDTQRNPDYDEIIEVLNNWAKAWSNKDTKSYLAFYSNEFQPAAGLSRKKWMEERQSRIEGKGRIDVKISTPQVTISSNNAVVKFRQIYVSDKLKADSRKTISLTKQNSKWQIVQERAGS